MEEGARDRALGVGIRLREVGEGRIGEDDPEAEGIVGPVALDHRDVVGGVGLLHEQGEVEPRRTGADADDLHAVIVSLGRLGLRRGDDMKK